MRSALNKSNPNWTWDLARRLRIYIPLQMRDRVRLSMRVQRRLYLSTRNAQAWDPRATSSAVEGVVASYTRFLTVTGTVGTPEKSGYRTAASTVWFIFPDSR